MELCDPIEDWQQFRHFKMGSFLEEVLISAAIVIHCERGEAKINGPRRVKRRPNPNGCAFIRLLSSEFKGSRGVRQILFSKPPNKLQSADIGLPTGNGKKLRCSQAQMGQATGLAVA